ncbi:hypothetical protein [Ralstonia sp. ASV6]|uniref:hypothetical protein n=1 Tax=Ralstonia sp. ASV6 TaxID=2795124 RepID=UPI0018EB3689|nr:hypothetical protein [Ralstonia sp. ASV6]
MSLDLSAMVSSLDVTTVVAVIVSFGAVWLVVDFVRWAVYEVGDFFDDVAVYRSGSVEEFAERFSGHEGRMRVASRVSDFIDRRRG